MNHTNNSLEQLSQKGYASFELPSSAIKAVGAAMNSWQNFCALPERERALFGYNANDGMGVGFELKKAKGTSLDLKEDFLYASGSRKWLVQRAEEVVLSSAADVVSQSDTVLQSLSPVIGAFAASVEKEFAIPGFAQEVMDSSEQWFLRMLHYFGDRAPNDEIATAHADKSGFTLHLYESDPGLQFLDFDMSWKDLDVIPGQTVILPGMRLQYRSEGRLKALYHRVIATEETAKKGRYSMVCFVHLKNTPQYDKSGHGRLQEFPPGFNYSMNHAEFRRFFK